MGDESKPRLDYDRTTATVHVRGFRLLLLLLLINTVMLGWFVAGPQTAKFAQQQWAEWKAQREARKAAAQAVAVQQQCLTHAFPADLVVFEEDPDLAKQLLAEGGRYEPIRVDENHRLSEWVPPVWLTRQPAFLAAPTNPGLGYNADLPIVFLHERTSPGGNRRLVAVQLTARQYFGNDRDSEVRITMPVQFLATAVQPGTLDVPAAPKEQASLTVRVPSAEETRLLTGRATYGQVVRAPPLRIFAGQPDPDDRSHFTIAYQLGQRAGVIDGWLRDEEIMLKPRAGRLLILDGKPVWELETATTATQPTTTPPGAP